MAALLLIRPSVHQPNLGDWMLLNEKNQIVEQAMNAPLAEVTSLATRYPTTLIIPSIDLLLTSVQLPATSRSKVLQAIPYALEEELSDDIETLHFAIGDKNQAGAWPVAIITKARLQAWLEPWQEQNINLVAIVPDVLTLPFSDQSWTLLLQENYALVRTGKFAGFTIEINNLRVFLQAVIEEQRDTPPQVLLVYHYHTPASGVDAEIGSLGFPVHDEKIESSLLAFIAPSVESSGLNLLQHEFRQRKKRSINKKIWLGTGLLTALLFLCFISKEGLEYYVLTQKKHVLTAQIDTLYHQVFPNATSVVAPKNRLEQTLKQLEGNQGSSDFLELLARAGIAFRTMPDITLQDLRFANNQLILTVKLDSFDNLAEFRHQLAENKLAVKQNSAESKNNQVIATLVITGKSS